MQFNQNLLDVFTLLSDRLIKLTKFIPIFMSEVWNFSYFLLKILFGLQSIGVLVIFYDQFVIDKHEAGGWVSLTFKFSTKDTFGLRSQASNLILNLGSNIIPAKDFDKS